MPKALQIRQRFYLHCMQETTQIKNFRNVFQTAAYHETKNNKLQSRAKMNQIRKHFSPTEKQHALDSSVHSHDPLGPLRIHRTPLPASLRLALIALSSAKSITKAEKPSPYKILYPFGQKTLKFQPFF